MRLLPLVALTLWLAGASARVGEDPYNKYRKEYGKGLPVEADDPVEDDEDYDDEAEDEKDGDDSRQDDDTTEDTGKTKETSVHRKHFMDQYFLHSGPVQYEFGHVCEDPKDWEHRYEKRDYDKNRHQGQVKWGDAHGGQGEHYWDFNHDGDFEDEEHEPWYHEPRTKGYQGRRPEDGRSLDDRTNDGNKARGIIKEKVTITKKKNGKMIDQTKINREKLANLDQILRNHEPKPFAGDVALIREFNRKTQGVKNKYNPFENFESEEAKGLTEFNDELRRMDTVPMDSSNSKLSEEKVHNDDRTVKVRGPRAKKFTVEETKEIRRYDVPQEKMKKLILSTESSADKPLDSMAKATIHIDTTGKAQFDPITGSLTESKTGKKFKIFGVLVDS